MKDLPYDPDKLVLTKKQIMGLIDAILVFWGKNLKENLLYISSLKTIKAAVYVTPESSCRKFWNTLFKFFLRVWYENQLESALLDGDEWAKTITKITKKIEDEGI